MVFRNLRTPWDNLGDNGAALLDGDHIMMKPWRPCLASLLLSLAGLPAAPDAVELPVAARSHVPAGWKVIEQVTGDLNGDGLPDLVFVREEQDLKKITKHPGIEGYNLNTNTRVMVVLLADKAGYRKVGESAKFVMPAHVDELEKFGDCYGGLTIAKGVVEVRFDWFASAGTWWQTIDIFKFRMEGGRFRLIGNERDSWHRSSGERFIESTNYLTGRRKHTTGLNQFDEKQSRAKDEWERFDAKKPLYLEDLPAGGQTR